MNLDVFAQCNEFTHGYTSMKNYGRVCDTRIEINTWRETSTYEGGDAHIH